MFEKIKSIRKTKIKDCYDIQMQNSGFRNVSMSGVKSNFIANNIVCKNSGGDARSSFSLQDTFQEFAEAKEFQKKYPLVADIAMKLEGNIRNCGIHAAAMIITDKPDYYYAPINKRGGVFCYEWEKQLCEDMHLIKFDILGLKTLTIIKDACKSAKVELPKEFEDKKVYDTVFKNANTIGIFQFSGTGIMKYISDLDISKFSELYDANSLFRPSCLHSGVAAVYKNRKLGREEASPYHESLRELTKNTQNLILYQETVMMIMVKIAGLSWATAEMCRKVITKSKGKDAFNKMRQDFVIGAQKVSKMTKEDAEKLFDVVSTYGSYGFNLSHSLSYSMLSYYCAWLKAYHPQHFYKALLKYETDDTEKKNFIQDAKKHGIVFESPDINKSVFSYEICDNKIYAGLNAVNGVGLKMAEKIISGRPYLSFADFKKRCKVSEKLLKGLIAADSFREFNINKKQEFYNQPSTEDFTEIELAQIIYEHTSLIPNLDVLKSFNFGDFPFVSLNNLKEYAGQQVFVRGIITDVLKKDKLLRQELTKHVHHFERHLLYLNLNDGQENIACQVMPETYEKYQSLIQFCKKQPVVIYGKVNADGKKIFADMLQISAGDNISTELSDILFNSKLLNAGEAFIMSARPQVSKAGRSYYRVVLSNGVNGLCFKFTEKLFPGLKVSYAMSQEPFINLKILK
jgi:DNA polymerase III alpha subunit